jgi:4-oxalocrotonate tautomerase
VGGKIQRVTRSEKKERAMPIVEVKLRAGRTREQKAELALRFTEVMVEVVGCPAKSVSVVFEDYLQSDWAEGGVLADEWGGRTQNL